MADLELKAWIGNLGKYNEGELVGEWVTFPATQEELEEVFDRIGINEEYEEYMINDYDGNVPSSIQNELGEYESLSTLNTIGYTFDAINEAGDGAQKVFEAMIDSGESWIDAACTAIDGDVITVEGNDKTDLAWDLLEQTDDIRDISGIDYMIDYERYGHDVDMEYYSGDGMPETAGEYYCQNEDASYDEIGEAAAELMGGVSNELRTYVDLERLGTSIDTQGNFAYGDGVIVDLGTTSSGNSIDDLRDLIDEPSFEEPQPKKAHDKGIER